jgi:3-isopropylmalate/(R)-2-methylmalate dehydratase small subunit
MTDNQKIDKIEGCGIPLRGNNIDTDRIIPARFLKAITFDGLGDHVFEDDRRAMPDHPFSDPRYKKASILVVNKNFGSGSSREHAPQALRRWGILGCVGESFSEIFQGNALSIGLACFTASPDDIEQLMRWFEETPDTYVQMSVSEMNVRVEDRRISVAMPDAFQRALLDGCWDATALLTDKFNEVRAVADGLPYVSGFSREFFRRIEQTRS